MEVIMKLRVWHCCQAGKVDNFYVDVENIEQARNVIDILSKYDLFQYENKIKPDYCNMSGLEYWDEKEEDWAEWEDEDGCDIWEHDWGEDEED